MGRAAGLLVTLALTVVATANQAIAPDARGFVVVAPEDVKFADGPMSQVNLVGDPGKPSR